MTAATKSQAHKAMLDQLGSTLGARVEVDKPLAPLTSFGTGGPARFFLEARSADEISRAVAAAHQLQLDLFLMGGGSNLLVSDAGFEGLVIRVGVKGLSRVDGGSIVVGAGEDLSELVTFSVAQGLTGLEFAAGIWGTVGGGIYGNAGAYGGQMGDLVESLQIVDATGHLKTAAADYCEFNYRHSRLKETGEIVVEAKLTLTPGDRDTIAARVDEILALREAKFPSHGTAGCIFKNIPDKSQPYGKLPAGKLLEEAGAKGMSVGGARVYEKHANIIVNGGSASSKDIRELADKIKELVKRKSGIILEEEIIQIGRF